MRQSPKPYMSGDQGGASPISLPSDNSMYPTIRLVYCLFGKLIETR